MRLAPTVFALAALALCATARAQTEVISHRPDAVSVTIYRDLFALITETRTVELPEGAVTLSFEGVVETLLPTSAVVADTGRELEERNYDYDPLTPGSLYERSIGEEVVLTRTLPGSGKVLRTPATIVAADDDGVTLRTADGLEALRCSGLPEQVTFSKVPDGLNAKPKLSVRLGAGPAGRKTVRVSYLAFGFGWKSDYVARLDAAGKVADLRGWLTLTNITNAGFRDAQVQVVAGNLHLIAEDKGGTSVFGDSDDRSVPPDVYERDERLVEMADELVSEAVEVELFGGCRKTLRPYDGFLAESLQRIGSEELDEVIVTEFRGSSAEAVRENLSDYQLYRLPWATDLAPRQTKQAVFLDKKRVKVERFYQKFVEAFDDDTDDDEPVPMLMLGIDNRKSAGLGEPLPAGVLRLFEPGATGDLFAGEGTLNDTAVGVPIEVTLAGAIDLWLDYSIQHKQEEDAEGDEIAMTAEAEVRISNAKGLPVTVEIRQPIGEYTANATLVKSSRRASRKFGDYAWRVRVPANSVETLTWRLRLPEPPKDED